MSSTCWPVGSRTLRRLALLLLPVLALMGAAQPAAAQDPEPRFRALVFTKTTGFRHTDAITQGLVAIRALADEHDFAVDATEDAGEFTEQNLARYDVVVLLNAEDLNVLNNSQEVAFEHYVQRGGGVVGIHSASNMHKDWPWYVDMMGGAMFRNHPSGALQFQTATVRVEDAAHPAMQGIPAEWVREDEWYNFTAEPRGKVHVLATLDESTYEEQDGSDEADDHPIAWCSNYDGGRSFYTALGHHGAYYAEPLYRAHLLGGIEWAAGVAEGDCGENREGIPSDSSFDKVTLDDSTENPMELAIAPDLSVYYVELAGKVKLFDPVTRQVRVVGTIPVHRGNENGLLGITLDPSFETNRWLYLFYSAPTPEEQHVSRFTVGTDGNLDMASEQVLLRIPHQRIVCCHSSGSMTFGPDGNLYISTGDDTEHAASNGFAPLDDDVLRDNPGENPDADRAYDSRRTSGNTNDLRGKILRIRPQPDGTYTIPEGNLFPPGTALTRPEIYTMGHRNPFRIQVDQETGWLYNGEVGPDANNDNASRGPRGYDEINQIRQAGNMGWPYCIADNRAYVDWTFPSGPSGQTFDCANGPTNASNYNTGLTQLPPARSAWLWWPYTPYPSDFAWPDIPTGPGRTAIAGPIYHFDADNPSETKFPEYYDDAVFFADWSRDWIALARLDENGMPADIERFMQNTEFRAPQDMEMGPDGSMYILEWGVDFNYAGENVNPDSGLYRIDYSKGRRTPVARATSDRDSGPAPLTVEFSSEGTFDPDGDEVTLAWSFGDGETSTEANPTHTFDEVGSYTVQLSVTDSTGKVGTSNLTIHAGNTRPTVAIDFPEEGGFFDWGDEIAYEVTVTDPEDATIACDRVTMQPGLFHDEGGNAHVHPGVPVTGCDGTFQTEAESGHDKNARISQVATASYTDSGGQPGSAPLSGGLTHFLNPKQIQAEHFDRGNGVTVANSGSAQGGARVGSGDVGDWFYFEPMNFRNIDSISALYSAGATAGGRVELRLDATDGPVIATLDLPATGGNNSYRSVTAPIAETDGAHRVYFVYSALPGGPATNLLNLDELTFNGKGLAINAKPAVSAQADPTSGELPLTVAFSGTASDPEGGALTYEWDFGDDSPVASTLDATHTYTAEGEYDATLTATDPEGRSGTATVTITVHPQPPSGDCFSAGSDQFDGTALDRELWDAVAHDAEGAYTVGGGALTLTAGAGDFTGTATNSPPLILQEAPEDEEWTLTTKVTFSPTANREQAGLLVYSGDDDIIKLDHVWADGRRVEMVKEVNDATTPLASVELPAGAPSTLYLRISFNGATTYRGHWSTDGAFWHLLATTTPDGVGDPDIGVYANNANQPGAGTPQAVFDWVGLDTGERPCPGAPTVQGFADPASGAAPLRVRFSATGLDPEGGQLSYRWSFADGTAVGRVVTRTFAEPGIYRAIVTATDPDGKIARDEVEVTVTPGAPPTVTADADVTSGPAPLRVRFEAAGEGDELIYAWDFGDGGQALGRRATHRYMEAGTYTATVTATDAAGQMATDELEITVTDPPGNRAPSVEAGAVPNAGPAPLRVRFTSVGTDPDGDALGYEWDFGDGGTASSRNATHTYTAPGTYTAEVTVTDPDGATGSAEVGVEVGGNRQPAVQAAADPGSGRAPLRVRFTSVGLDPDGGQLTYAWDFGDAGQAGGRNATHTYAAPGEYTATVTATDADGATASADVDVSVTAARGVFGTLAPPAIVLRR
jgi:cytochrome c